MNYDYTAYGLSLRSDVELPGLEQATEVAKSRALNLATKSQPDWVKEASTLPSEVIHFLPATPECADPAFVVREYDGGRFYQLSYSDGTEFFVDSASEAIWGCCPAPLTIEDLSTYFLGPVMGFVLRGRGVTPLHASAVILGESAIVISGAAAAGKSTAAAAFALRGAPVLCEDIAALHNEAGRYFVQPGYPRVCLWPDSVQKLLGSEEALPNLTPNWEKKYLGLDGKQAKFEARKMPIGGIYLLGARLAHESAPRLEEISAREALLGLVQNTYMNMLLTKQQRAAEFEWLSRLVNSVPCKRAIAHADAARLGMFCEMIGNDARSLSANRLRPIAATQN